MRTSKPPGRKRRITAADLTATIDIIIAGGVIIATGVLATTIIAGSAVAQTIQASDALRQRGGKLSHCVRASLPGCRRVKTFAFAAIEAGIGAVNEDRDFRLGDADFFDVAQWNMFVGRYGEIAGGVSVDDCTNMMIGADDFLLGDDGAFRLTVGAGELR